MKLRRTSSSRSPRNEPGRARRDRKERLQLCASWATIVGVPIMVILGMWQQGVFSSESQAVTRMVHLEPAGVVVYNDMTPQIEVTLHNTGTGLAVLESATIAVRRVTALKQCFSAGVIPLGGSYSVPLPAKPRAGEVIQAPLHEQVAANAVDRFRLSLGTPGEHTTSTINLLQLNVVIAHDRSATPIQLGAVLIAAPVAPHEDGYYLTRRQLSRGAVESESEILPDTGHSLYEELAPCWRANRLRLKEMGALKGVRSSAMQMAMAEAIIPPAPAAGTRAPRPLGG